jgi:hypothetical protein
VHIAPAQVQPDAEQPSGGRLVAQAESLEPPGEFVELGGQLCRRPPLALQCVKGVRSQPGELRDLGPSRVSPPEESTASGVGEPPGQREIPVDDRGGGTSDLRLRDVLCRPLPVQFGEHVVELSGGLFGESRDQQRPRLLRDSSGRQPGRTVS